MNVGFSQEAAEYRWIVADVICAQLQTPAAGVQWRVEQTVNTVKNLKYSTHIHFLVLTVPCVHAFTADLCAVPGSLEAQLCLGQEENICASVTVGKP